MERDRNIPGTFFKRKDRAGKLIEGEDLFGTSMEIAGAGISNAGRPRLSIRLMASLLYLKHSFNHSDEELAERWSENVVWQYVSGMEYYEPRLPCNATQIGRFRNLLGEEGLEKLLKFTIETAVQIKAVKSAEFERVIVDTTVQEKAIAYPVDSRLLEIARHQVVKAAKRVGILLKQTYAQEGKALRRKAGGYAHAKQFKRMKKAVKRQRTILGVVMREVQRKLDVQTLAIASDSAHVEMPSCLKEISVNRKAIGALQTLLERAERIRTQQQKDKNKLYALHAPEVECLAKGKARKPYEFGVKVSLVVTHKQGLMVGAKRFAGNPYDGNTLADQLEHANALLDNIGVIPTTAIVDLGFRGVDEEVAPVNVIHRGKYKSLTPEEKRWLKHRQAIEPRIGHTKSDNRMDRCWLKGSTGDTLHALSCAAGYNIRWLLRAIMRLDLKPVFLRLLFVVVIVRIRSILSIQLVANCFATFVTQQQCWATKKLSWSLA